QGGRGRDDPQGRRGGASDRLRRTRQDLLQPRLRPPYRRPARPWRAATGLRHRRRRRPRRERARRRRLDPGLRPPDLAPRPRPGHADRADLSRRDHPGRIALSSRLMRRALPTLLAFLIALPVAAAAPQQSTSEAGRLQAEFRDERARALRLRAEAAEAAAEIARLERELAGLRADVAAGDARIAAQRARLRQLSEREAALVARLAQARGRQTRLLSALQMMSR